MAVQENVNAIGVSFLGGGHLFYASKLLHLMKENGLEGITLFTGGVIPPGDVEKMKQMGVAAVFTPGSRRDIILDTIRRALEDSQ
jgi:methylmalonyl-CoA mutase, C-terminal domain